jgi:hypothetical protein
MRKFSFYTILILLLSFVSIAGFEVSYRLLYKFVPQLFTKNPYTEQDYKDVLYPEGTVNMGGGLKENFDSYVLEPYGKIAYWDTDSHGFRYHKEISVEKNKNTIRIFSLGDSFTAGYRIDQEKTFSFLLDQFLNKNQNGKTVEVPIAHTSNPSTALEYLQKYGSIFKPEIVIIGITIGNDFAQNYLNMDSLGLYVLDSNKILHRKTPIIGFHNGLDTLRLPNTCMNGKGKTTLPNELYNENFDGLNRLVSYRLLKKLQKRNHQGISVVSFYSGMTKTNELFDACNGLGLYLKKPTIHIEKAYQSMDLILSLLKELSVKDKYRLIIVPFPQRFQVQKEDWAATVEDYALKADCFDLNIPNKRLEDICQKKSLEYYDPTQAMIEAYQNTQQSLYLPNGDMHWNAWGNEVVFEFLKDKIVK